MAHEHATSVWEALVDSPEEAENLRLRSELMMIISDTVEDWGISQKDAAKRLHVTAPRLSDLMNGKIDKFSLDALVKLLAGAHLKIEMTVKQQAA